MPHLEGVRHRWVRAGDVELHVAEAGAGEPVVLLHGWPQHWWMWRHLIAALATDFHVIAPDLRGYGWSEAPRGGYDKEQFAADVLALLDALGLERVRLAGHDWGGVAAFMLCVDHPERVSQYLALNTGHPWIGMDARMAAHLWAFSYQLALASPGAGPWIASRPETVRLLFRSVATHRAGLEGEVDVYAGRFREPARARAASQTYRTFLLREVLPLARGRYRGRRLSTPTLWLHGTADPVISRHMVESVRPHADDITIEWVEGCGHFIAEERPDVVVDRALTFFGAPRMSS